MRLHHSAIEPSSAKLRTVAIAAPFHQWTSQCKVERNRGRHKCSSRTVMAAGSFLTRGPQDTFFLKAILNYSQWMPRQSHHFEHCPIKSEEITTAAPQRHHRGNRDQKAFSNLHRNRDFEVLLQSTHQMLSPVLASLGFYECWKHLEPNKNLGAQWSPPLKAGVTTTDDYTP